MDEGSDLHMLHAGGDQGIDDFQFLFCRQVFFQVLEPVTGPHFDDFDFLSHDFLHLPLR